MPSECEARAVSTVHDGAMTTHTGYTSNVASHSSLALLALLGIRKMMRYVTRLSKGDLTGVQVRPLKPHKAERNPTHNL